MEGMIFMRINHNLLYPQLIIIRVIDHHHIRKASHYHLPKNHM